MPVLNKNSRKEVEKYNEFLRKHKAQITQDLRWQKVKSNWIQECVYTVDKKGNITGAMTILLNKLPMFNSYLMYASRGPVCENMGVKALDALVKEAEPIRKKYNAFCLKVDPLIKANAELEKEYTDNGYKVQKEHKRIIQPRFNMVLDIKGKTEEELFKGFAEKTRYNIRVATKKGVTVRDSRDLEDLKKFYELYKTTTIRDRIGCRPFEYFERMLENFDRENECRVYVAEHDGKALSAAIAITNGEKMFYIYGASSNEDRNLMPNYLMQLYMIRWGIELKCENYDFGGVFEFTSDNGLYRFKSGFCKQEGVTEYIGEIDKVYRPVLYYIYTYIVPNLREIKKKLRKKSKK